MAAATTSIPAAAEQPDTPPRGTTMLDVEKTWGSPVLKMPPVGNPPVSRWTYPGFTVYFEHQFVIHAVTGSARQ